MPPDCVCAGATASAWTTPALALGDDGSQAQVGVTNGYGGVLSSAATLHVSAVSPPVIPPSAVFKSAVFR